LSTEDLRQWTVEDFDGLNTYQGSWSKVPVGRSPACENVEFAPGRVYTRAGITQRAVSTFPITSIKEFVTRNGVRRLMWCDNQGQLYRESNTPWVFDFVSGGLADTSIAATDRFQSATLFGREYLALCKDYRGTIAPKQYNDTYLDRVAPGGPGIAPAVVDGAAGNISAGLHKLRVFFRTRNGFWTALGPPVSWTAAGAKVATVTVVTTGPPWVTERVIAATPKDSDDYYFIEGTTMVLHDNTAVAATIDFTDANLIAGTPVSSALNPDEDQAMQIELPPQGGCIAYHDRLVWWGERNTIRRIQDIGFINTSFDGGFIGNVPNGWTELVTGELKGTDSSSALEQNDFLRIVGNGVGQRGCLENSGNASAFIPAGTQINARVRARRVSAGAPSGRVDLYLCPSATAAITIPLGSLVVNSSSLVANNWTVIEGQVLSAANNSMDSTWRLRVTGNGGAPIPLNDEIQIQSVELYVADEGTHKGSLLRISKPSDPESYHALTGYINVNEDDGQPITNCFVLRDVLFVVKSHSMYAVRDDGSSEPAFWPVSIVDETVGSPFARGVSMGEGWAVIASRGGLYFYGGGTPIKISEEIQATWDTVTWANANAGSWVLVDTEKRRIFAAIPTASTYPDVLMVFEWIGDSPVAPGNRDAGIWRIAGSTFATCAAFSERPDATRATVFGTRNGTSANPIGTVDDSARGSDFGTGYASYYQLAFTPQTTRTHIGFTRIQAFGSGTLTPSYYQTDEATALALATWTLPAKTAAGAKSYQEFKSDVQGERLSLRVAVSAGGNFSLQRVDAFIQTDETTPVRGTKS
jgi:hypothetical protein